jgi:hypothetical protein
MRENPVASVRLSTGRVIVLESLEQQKSYLGLLEGVPNKRMNDDIIAQAVTSAKTRHPHFRATAHLIAPNRRDHELEPGDMEKLKATATHLVPEFIPTIQCVAVFNSFQPRHGSRHDYSSMCLIWFQDWFALPIANEVIEGIIALDWDRHAADCDY